MNINKINYLKDYAEITVINNEVEKVVLVDIEDLTKFSKIRVTKANYAYICKKNKLSLPEVILGVKTNLNSYIDHINGNTLDNRKYNLRFCTPSENAKNRHSYSRNNTGIVGISYRENKNYKYYRVSVTSKGGNKIEKQFNIRLIGKEEAFEKAKEYLLELKKQNNYIV
jgi:hypothetical protein